MDIILLSTRDDEASMNMRENLLPSFKESKEHFMEHPIFTASIGSHQCRLLTSNSPLLYHETTQFEADLLIFLSKHSSASGKPSLSAHFTGNFAQAEMGGQTKMISTASPLFAKKYLLSLSKAAQDTYDITLEATHHGPLVKIPHVFVEIGSSYTEWIDRKAGKSVAQSLIDAISSQDITVRVALGFGGTHYCQGFNKLELGTEIALSHICPKHLISSLDITLIRQMIENSNPKPSFAILDWKGIDASSKEYLIDLLQEGQVEWKKLKEFKS
jgi:D-aminoacyl-tRNA deacylase